MLSQSDSPELEAISTDSEQKESGYITYYGLYWEKCSIDLAGSQLLGLPGGWQQQGRVKAGGRADRAMNFWGQKGIYVLYDAQMVPIYVGQAGAEKKKKDKKSEGGRTLGDRLKDHRTASFRTAWHFFSWFGFLETEFRKELKGKLGVASSEQRLNPNWKFITRNGGSTDQLLDMLDSFEAILVEASSPRFNSRGGNLKDAVLVDQLECA